MRRVPGDRSRSRAWLFLVASGVASLVLASCAGEPPSLLQPRGPAGERVAALWWLMLVLSSVVVLLVAALITVAVVRRRRAAPGGAEPRWPMRLVIGGGVVLPVIVLSVLWGLTLRDMAALSEPAARTTLTVQVTGEQFWWRVRYPDAGVETANDIHIPVGTPVRIELDSADVVHSFWVPELGTKMDMVPGRDNAMWVQADEPGVYRGQCAEFCGVQHANMIFFVIAEPADEFEAWLEREAQDAEEPADAQLAQGRDVFAREACSACHTIRGVSEVGTLGPDLTHVGSRRTIGAGAAPNDLEHLLAWIPNSQAIKPGNLMPPVPLTTEDLDALARYLESLE